MEEELNSPLLATMYGFSLHAGTVCEAHQRSKLERLCRYITRPPIAPNFKHRQRIVPHRSKARIDSDKPVAPLTWITRLKRAFLFDIEQRPHCSGKLRVAAPAHGPGQPLDRYAVSPSPCARGISASMRVIACVEEPALIAKILGHVRARDELDGTVVQGCDPGHPLLMLRINSPCWWVCDLERLSVRGFSGVLAPQGRTWGRMSKD